MKHDQSIFKGYPFGEPISQKIFPQSQRPYGQVIDKAAKDELTVPAEVVGLYSHALHEAETQVRDLQTQYPFIPEDYGFVEIREYPPVYRSFDENIYLHDLNDQAYRLVINNREIVKENEEKIFIGNMTDIIVKIENERDAYMAFKMLGALQSLKTKSSENDTITSDPNYSSVGYPVELTLNNSPKPLDIEPKTNEESTGQPVENTGTNETSEHVAGENVQESIGDEAGDQQNNQTTQNND